MHKQRIRLIQLQPVPLRDTTLQDRKMLDFIAMRVKPPTASPLHNEMARSVSAIHHQQLLLQLQRRLGNSYVGRLIDSHRGVIAGHAKPGAPLIINRQMDSIPPEQVAADPVPPVSGAGEPHEALAFAPSPNIRLRGRTRARFNGGNFRTENVVTAAGSGCKRCRGKNCVHVTGTVVAEYHVTTTVTLPRASDFRRLTRCQKERVQGAIDSVLVPHEQQHVDAFETYNGRTEQPFDLTLCRNQLPGAIRKMVRDEERPRRAAAQAASNSLDPFNFDVDLDCED